MAIPVALRRRVTELAGGRCEYCPLPQSHSPAPFAADHILPRSLEGDDEIENLALACQGCNGAKYNKTHGLDPTTAAVVALFHPRQQRWNDHFAWSDDTLIVVGLSEFGRATIATLHLNREGAINLRDVLHSRGLHPPPQASES